MKTNFSIIFAGILSLIIGVGISTNKTMWIILRFLAGFGTAMCLIVSTSLVMVNLNINDKTKIMGIHFTGIGFAIVSTDVIVKFVNIDANLWQTSWVVLSLFSFILFIYPWRVLFEKRVLRYLLF